MNNTHRIIPMRGFCTAVSRGDVSGLDMAISGVAIGIDGPDDHRQLAIAFRHTDGTLLTAYLDMAQLARFGAIVDCLLADQPARMVLQ